MVVHLSVIVPTYNERENLGELLARIDRALKGCGAPYEVIVVDDSSPDGTAELAKELSKAYPVKVLKRPGRLGLASAVLSGLKVAEGEAVAVMDADLQHPPELLPRMLEELRACDVVVASRYVKGGSVRGWPLLRRLTSRGATLIAGILIPKVRGVRDPMSGYFMFRRSAVEGAVMNPRGFKLLLELLVKGKVSGVREVPYTFSTRIRGKSKLGAGEVFNYLLHVLALAPEYVRFTIVGAAGVLVNLGALALLVALRAPHLIASAVAIEASLINNFLLNDLWTFKGGGGGWWSRLAKFHFSSALSLLAQWVTSVAVYYLVVSYPLLAQLAGILVGFPINYILSKRLIWQRGQHA